MNKKFIHTNKHGRHFVVLLGEKNVLSTSFHIVEVIGVIRSDTFEGIPVAEIFIGNAEPKPIRDARLRKIEIEEVMTKREWAKLDYYGDITRFIENQK